MSTTDPKQKMERSKRLAPGYALSNVIKSEPAIDETISMFLNWLDAYASSQDPMDLDKFFTYLTFDVGRPCLPVNRLPSTAYGTLLTSRPGCGRSDIFPEIRVLRTRDRCGQLHQQLLGSERVHRRSCLSQVAACSPTGQPRRHLAIHTAYGASVQHDQKGCQRPATKRGRPLGHTGFLAPADASTS